MPPQARAAGAVPRSKTARGALTGKGRLEERVGRIVDARQFDELLFLAVPTMDTGRFVFDFKGEDAETAIGRESRLGLGGGDVLRCIGGTDDLAVGDTIVLVK